MSLLKKDDHFATYMRDVGRYSLLTPDEERELTTRYALHRAATAGRERRHSGGAAAT